MVKAAATLEIQLIADVARLQKDMRDMQKAVDTATGRVSTSFNNTGVAASKMARDAQVAAAGITRVGNTGKLASHHMLNLSHQINDVVVSLASGQNPMTVFMQQGSQIGGIAAQAGVGLGAMAKALLAMAGAAAKAVLLNPVLLGIAAAAGMAYGSFKLLQSEVKKTGELDNFAKSLGLTKKELKELEGVGITAGDVFKGLWKTIDDGLGLSGVFTSIKSWAIDTFRTAQQWGVNAGAGIYAAFAGSYEAIKTVWDRFPAIMGDFATQAVNAHIRAIEWLINKAIAGINLLASGANAVMAAMGFDTRIGKLQSIEFAELANANAGAVAKAAADIGASYSSAFNTARSAMDGFFADWRQNSIDAAKNRLRGQANDIIGDRTEKAAKKAKEKTDEFLEGLDKARIEIDNFFRKNDPVKKLTEEWERNSPLDAIIKEIDRIREMEVEWQKVLGEAELQKAREAAERYADSINGLINALGGLGGVGGALGGLIGLFSGQTGAISGPIGDLLNITTSGTKKDASGREIARNLGDELRDIFKLSGEFGKTMTSLLGGAGTGMIAGQAIFGRQSQTEQLGSALGGALGKVAGDAIGKSIGGLAGQLGGPLGSILGGVLGGVLGGMFSKTPWGRVTLSSQGASNPEGNSGASRRAAVKAGGSFDTALQEIADAFGGGIGDFGNITLGVRHGDWRVNATGTSLKKKKGATDFDGDAEGAIAFAIQIAIERGAITGIRESTQRLLKSSDDLKRNLDRALSFEAVFKELASIKDPVGFAMDELTREFDRLRDIFEEAGASAAEYADLEELLAHKRQEVADKAAKEAIDKLSDRNSIEVELLRLLGREEDALAAARLNELANLESSLQPLQAMVYQLQDARAVMDQFGPLADDLKAFRAEIMGGGATNNGMAFVERQFRETAALARDGDAKALGNLRGTATEFLDAAKANASSALEYQRAVGEVLASVDEGIFAADSQIEYAQMQIDAINNSANILQSMKDEMATYQQRLLEQGEWVERQFRRWDSEGIRIQNDSTTPIYTEAA